MFDVRRKFEPSYLYCPDDIANVLCKLSVKDDVERLTEDTVRDVTDAIYYLKACAENEYNAEMFRTLCKVLDGIVENSGEYLESENIPMW